MKKKMMIFSLVLCVILTNNYAYGLDESVCANFDCDTINKFIKMGKKGIISAFVGKNQKYSTSSKQTSFIINNSEDFQGNLFIGNFNSNIESFYITCLINYNQITFSIDDKNALFHKIQLDSLKYKEFTVNIGTLEKGVHDFLLLITKIVNFKQSNVVGIQSVRANIFCESEKFFNFIESPQDVKIKQITNKNRFSDFFLSSKKNDEFELVANNINDRSLKFAVIIFSNFKQIKPSMFFNLSPNTKLKMPLSLKNKKNVFAIKVNNPFIVLEPYPNILTKSDIDIKSSNIINFKDNFGVTK